MCYKDRFISRYNTFKHYYTLLFFLLFFLLWHMGLLFFLLFFLLWHIGLLFFILFFLLLQIIFHYVSCYFQIWQGVCTRKLECVDSNSWSIHWGMTDKCPWAMPAQLHRLEGAYREEKAAWCSVPGLLYALLLLLCTLFFLADQDCGCCKYVLRTADLFKLILCVRTSLGDIREAAIAVWSAQIVPFLKRKSNSLLAHKHLRRRRTIISPLHRRVVQSVSVPWRSFVQCPFQLLSVT